MIHDSWARLREKNGSREDSILLSFADAVTHLCSSLVIQVSKIQQKLLYFESSPRGHFKIYIWTILDIYFDMLPHALSGIYSGNLFDMYSDILFNILPDTYSDILSGIYCINLTYTVIFYPAFCLAFFSDSLFNIYYDILSDTHSGILSDVYIHIHIMTPYLANISTLYLTYVLAV